MSVLNTRIYDEAAGKQYVSWGWHSELHRSSFACKCPFCSEVFTAFASSMSAVGKKCPKCGAIHFRNDIAYPPKIGMHND